MIEQFICMGSGLMLGIAIASATVKPGLRYGVIVAVGMFGELYIGSLK